MRNSRRPKVSHETPVPVLEELDFGEGYHRCRRFFSRSGEGRDRVISLMWSPTSWMFLMSLWPYRLRSSLSPVVGLSRISLSIFRTGRKSSWKELDLI